MTVAISESSSTEIAIPTTACSQVISERSISKETSERFGVLTTVVSGVGTTKHFYPYFMKDTNEPCAYKERTCSDKTFRWLGNSRTNQLFGQQLFPPGVAKTITLVEGEVDALSVYEMMGNFPVVSVKDGAQSAERAVKNNLEYFESFENVVIMLDNDEQGQKASIKVANLLKPGKAKIFPHQSGIKDANEYLTQNKKGAFTRLWWASEVYKPDSIVASSSLKEAIKNMQIAESFPYPWQALNDLTYGLRATELVTVTAETGVGKTQFLREIVYHLLKKHPSAKIGTLFLEERTIDSALGIMSLEANRRLHLPDTEYTEAEWESWFQATLEPDKVFFYDHFGSNEIDEILNKIRYMAKGLDCKYIFLDHLSIIVSDQRSGDERKSLDEITTKLKSLCMELEICVIAVVHLNREGKIRGTAGIEQLSNIVIHLSRDKTSSDENIRNTTIVTVQKNRFSGATGPGGFLKFDPDTGRLESLDKLESNPLEEF